MDWFFLDWIFRLFLPPIIFRCSLMWLFNSSLVAKPFPQILHFSSLGTGSSMLLWMFKLLWPLINFKWFLVCWESSSDVLNFSSHNLQLCSSTVSWTSLTCWIRESTSLNFSSHESHLCWCVFKCSDNISKVLKSWLQTSQMWIFEILWISLLCLSNTSLLKKYLLQDLQWKFFWKLWASFLCSRINWIVSKCFSHWLQWNFVFGYSLTMDCFESMGAMFSLDSSKTWFSKSTFRFMSFDSTDSTLSLVSEFSIFGGFRLILITVFTPGWELGSFLT